MADDTGRLQAAVERGIGGLLRFDERLVEGGSGPVAGPLDPATLPWTAPIEARWPDIRAELDRLLASDVRLPVTDDLVGVEQGADGRWTTYVLCWFGEWLEFNCRRCPETTALIRDVPGVEIAGFTVMHGGTHIPRHQGPAKALRYQVGVRVPDPPGSSRLRVGDTTIEHAEGRSLLFDDRTPHEAWNDSDEDRYVFFVQVHWPLGGVRGGLHRLGHWAFGRAQTEIPRRAEELDAALNRDR